MKASSMTLQKIFEQTIRYKIPLFQRPYVWNEQDNWLPVWEDIKRLSERHLRRGNASPHFLGAIVLDQMRGPTGTIEVRQVIDGQQRLTTIQVILAVLRDLAKQHGVNKYASRFEKLTANDESFHDDADDEFKVWPTNRDREDYRRTLKAGSEEELRKAYEVGKGKKKIGAQIPDAYLFFSRVLSEWLKRDGDEDDGDESLEGTIEERFESLWSIIQGHLLIVAIDLEEDDDAQVIFETLNARGSQLLPADLVKNYLFHLAELEESQIEHLYERYWRAFDEDFWRKEVRQGRLKRPRIDLFLQHYLTLKTNDEVNVGHIFGVFKHHCDTATKLVSGNADEAVKESSEDHLERLKQYGSVFRKFHAPSPGSRSALFFERLVAIDTATVFPFLLEAFHKLDTAEGNEQLETILVDIESFLARRMICGLTTKNYNRLFLDLVRDAEKAGVVTAEGVRTFLMKMTGDSVRWPNDEEMRTAVLTRPFYSVLSQQKMRMVLQALDIAMESGKSEEILYTSKLTIEHLLPQAWRDHWPLPDSDGDDEAEQLKKKEAREAALHSIGNLTLLTKKLNPSISNSGWDAKRPEILKHSKLNMNRYFQEKEAWNEQEIENRSGMLFDIAKVVWPYPTEAKG